jgi:predicted nuclease of predicted toxin-antitoxin system
MRILLDESLPKELKAEFAGHDTLTVREIGWSGVKNGELLVRAAAQFDVFITADQNLRYQQNLSALPFAVAVLVAKSNRIETLRPLIPKLLTSLATLPARTLVQIDS